MSTAIQLLVGLGNPGAQYQSTRHNAGFWFIDTLAEQLSAPPFKLDKKLSAYISKTQYNHRTLILAKPTTFMNESGLAVQALVRFYKIGIPELLIAHDELDLAPGTLKLKTGGGTAGHNGLKSIIKSLGQQADFHRIRIGIGHPGHAKKVYQYVLSKPNSQDEYHAITNSFSSLLSHHLDNLLSGQVEAVMKAVHTQ